MEVGCAITLFLSVFPGLFGDMATSNLRAYNIIVCVILFITVLFANFAESVAEGRGKAQAASLKKTQKDTQAHLLGEGGIIRDILSSELKKGDVVVVSAGEIIPEMCIRDRYKGVVLTEFDLDAALARRPQLILVDELAHSNAAGCRHAKRYQDIDCLLYTSRCV